MPDNTDVELPDDLSNAEAENSSNNITPTINIDPIIQNQEPENMEVHHHAHHGEKKSWKSYAREFFMLFLAVFCGFLAEYQLEHRIEAEREKLYIRSMIEDLAADTSNLSDVTVEFNLWDLQVDTVLKMYPNLAKGYNDTLLRNMFLTRGFPDFIYTDRTMQQLKNPGGMRLVHSKTAANGIVDYDSKVRDIINIDQPSLQTVFEKYLRFWNELIDEEAIETDKHILTIYEMEKNHKNYLLKTDKASLGNLNNTIREFKFVAEVLVQAKEVKLKASAIHLIALLTKEYHLE